MNADAEMTCFVTEHRKGHPYQRGTATLLLDLDSITPGIMVKGATSDPPARYIEVPPAAVPMLEKMIAAIIDIFATENHLRA